MEDTLEKANIEVGIILNIMGEDYKNKLPKKIRDFYDVKNINSDSYKSVVENIKKFNVSRTALIIISIFNLKYWEQDENEKKRLISIYKANEKNYQEKINRYKNEEWLNNKKITIEKEENNITQKLIIQDNKSLLKKIKDIIKRIFKRR